MYGKGGAIGAVTATTVTVGAVALPNTGGNFVVTLAISIAAGLVVWGALYARSTTN
jgi:LPXTG-motif cell wall-anchored protein